MADYKPTFTDQLLALLPSLIAPTLQYKLGKDQQAAQNQRHEQQLNLQREQMAQNKLMANEAREFALEKAMFEIDATRGLNQDKMAMQLALAKSNQEAELDMFRIKDASAERRFESEQDLKLGLAEVSALVEARKLADTKDYRDKTLAQSQQKIDMMISPAEEKEIKKKEKGAIPLSSYGDSYQTIIDEPESLISVDEEAMFKAFNDTDLQQNIRFDVDRLKDMPDSNLNKQSLISRLKEMRQSFGDPALVGYMGKSKSKDAKKAKSNIAQLDLYLALLGAQGEDLYKEPELQRAIRTGINPDMFGPTGY